MLPSRARAVPLPRDEKLGHDDTTELRAKGRARATRPPRLPDGTVADAATLAIRIADVVGKGRGVFATRRILRGEVIERAPVLVIPPGQVKHVEATMLDHYVYDWQGEQLALALGHGSLFNHGYEPNAVYAKRFDEGVLEYTALRDIELGEEILINYNGDPKDQAPVWFDVVA
jgi:hypothetical protein